MMTKDHPKKVNKKRPKSTAYAVKNTNISKQSQKQNSGSKIKKIHTTRKEKIHIFVKNSKKSIRMRNTNFFKIKKTAQCVWTFGRFL